MTYLTTGLTIPDGWDLPQLGEEPAAGPAEYQAASVAGSERKPPRKSYGSHIPREASSRALPGCVSLLSPLPSAPRISVPRHPKERSSLRRGAIHHAAPLLPEISKRVVYDPHMPPHFRAELGGYWAHIQITSGDLLEGNFPSKK